jgi:hypothetical protein
MRFLGRVLDIGFLDAGFLDRFLDTGFLDAGFLAGFLDAGFLDVGFLDRFLDRTCGAFLRVAFLRARSISALRSLEQPFTPSFLHFALSSTTVGMNSALQARVVCFVLHC